MIVILKSKNQELANFGYLFPDRQSTEAEIIDLYEPYLKVLHDKDMDVIEGKVNLWKR